MFIAHLPAGYLLTRSLQNRFQTKRFIWVGLVASILPDIDLFYFFYIDHRQTLHHEYWTHWPLLWLALWLLSLIVILILKKRSALIISTLFFSNLFLHFVLDTYVGGINWLYPFVDHNTFLLNVPARHSFWIANFIFHWTFLVEIIISLAALWIFMSTKKKSELLPD